MSFLANLVKGCPLFLEIYDEEVEEVIPLAVDETTLPEPDVESGKETIKTLDMNSIMTGIVKAFQEQQEEIETLKQEVEELKGG